MRRSRRTVPVALAAAALTACAGPTVPPPEFPPTPVPARTGWALSHRITESDAVQITGHNIGHYDEASYVSLGRAANGFDLPCYVTVSVPGQGGGPESMIGEKVPTIVQGRPGFRNGAGAEAAYVMWQHAGESWTMVHCDLDHPRFVDVVANAVQFRPSSIRLPFDIDALPERYGLSNITSDFARGSTAVYFGVVNAAFGHAEPDSVISLETGELSVPNPPGRPTTINGRKAVLSEDRENPGVCVLEQQRYLCVAAFSGDTGPHPDRSSEIPTLLGIAEGLQFAEDLDDRSTWFAAEHVFG